MLLCFTDIHKVLQHEFVRLQCSWLFEREGLAEMTLTVETLGHTNTIFTNSLWVHLFPQNKNKVDVLQKQKDKEQLVKPSECEQEDDLKRGIGQILNLLNSPLSE